MMKSWFKVPHEIVDWLRTASLEAQRTQKAHVFSRFEAACYLLSDMNRKGKLESARYYQKVFGWRCNKQINRLMNELALTPEGAFFCAKSNTSKLPQKSRRNTSQKELNSKGLENRFASHLPQQSPAQTHKYKTEKTRKNKTDFPEFSGVFLKNKTGQQVAVTNTPAEVNALVAAYTRLSKDDQRRVYHHTQDVSTRIGYMQYNRGQDIWQQMTRMWRLGELDDTALGKYVAPVEE